MIALTFLAILVSFFLIPIGHPIYDSRTLWPNRRFRRRLLILQQTIEFSIITSHYRRPSCLILFIPYKGLIMILMILIQDLVHLTTLKFRNGTFNIQGCLDHVIVRLCHHTQFDLVTCFLQVTFVQRPLVIVVHRC